MTLTSIHNPRVRHARALLERRRDREREQRFVVEGVRLIESALAADARPDFAFYTADLAATERGAALVAALAQVTDTLEITPAVMRTLSDTETPQGILAVVPFPAPRPVRSDLALVVDGVRDPGNLGALLRSAAAAAVDTVWLAPGTVDLYNPKTVRAGMGAHFQLAARHAPWDQVAAALREAGLTVRVAAGEAATAYFTVDWTIPSALVVGSEAEGAGPEARRLAHQTVAIPMPGRAESLNVAMAATVILFEAQRQRTLRPPPA